MPFANGSRSDNLTGARKHNAHANIGFQRQTVRLYAPSPHHVGLIWRLFIWTFVQASTEAEDLSQAFRATGALPPNAQTDAAHLAIATAAGADYLLTWNCRHLANAQILRRLEREALRHGWKLPHVCTPAELMGDLPYESESDS